MKVTKTEMEVFSKFLEAETKRIQGAVAKFRLTKQPLDFEEIQSAICAMAMRLPEFYEPGPGEDGQGGSLAPLKDPTPGKTPGYAKRFEEAEV